MTIAYILEEYINSELENLEEFDLGSGIWIKVMPDWARQDDIIKDLSRYKKMGIEGARNFVLTSEYNVNSKDFNDIRETRDNNILKLLLTNLALWLARPSSLSFDCVVHIQNPDCERVVRRCDRPRAR